MLIQNMHTNYANLKTCILIMLIQNMHVIVQIQNMRTNYANTKYTYNCANTKCAY